MVAKAEHIDGKSNPRFIVTSLPAAAWAARPLYEDLYCARGDMENRIKEQFVLFADRVSAASMRANQLRLYLSVDGLFAGVRTAPLGTASDIIGPRASRYDSFTAAEDRRPDSSDSAQDLDTDVAAASRYKLSSVRRFSNSAAELTSALRATRSLTNSTQFPKPQYRCVFSTALKAHPTHASLLVPVIARLTLVHEICGLGPFSLSAPSCLPPRLVRVPGSRRRHRSNSRVSSLNTSLKV